MHATERPNDIRPHLGRGNYIFGRAIVRVHPSNEVDVVCGDACQEAMLGEARLRAQLPWAVCRWVLRIINDHSVRLDFGRGRQITCQSGLRDVSRYHVRSVIECISKLITLQQDVCGNSVGLDVRGG